MTVPAETPEQLINSCQGLVRSLAWKIHAQLPPRVDVEDLIGYGQIGVAEAARDFDPARGGKFSTYAYYRIRGAIYDGLSKMVWFGGAQRQRLRFEQRAHELLAVENDAAPLDSPAVEEEVAWLERLAGGLAVTYLTLHSDDDEPNAAELADPQARSPAAEAMGREATQVLGQLIDELPAEASSLIRATYFEGLTLQEAGQRLGVGKAWASRLHAKTLQRLARSMRLRGLAD